MTNLNSILRWVLAVVIVLIILAVAWVFWLKTSLPQAHLIPGVPYFGQFLGYRASNQEPVAVRNILNYWGRSEVTEQELISTFEANGDTSADKLTGINTNLATDFFTNLGFTAERRVISDPEYLKFLIANNVPVYVKQGLGSAYMPELTSTRVYIGYSNKNDEFIVHDNNFGNNFTISYDEYEKISDNQVVVVVYPKDYVLQERPRNESADPSSYPARLGIMDDLELRDLGIKIMEFTYYKLNSVTTKKYTVDEVTSKLEEVVNHKAFTKLHPAAQMLFSYNLAGYYMEKEQLSMFPKAISILENITIPLIENYDFSKSYGGWDRKMDPAVYNSPDFNSAPWSSLGYSYGAIGQFDKSEAAYRKALEYHPDFAFALEQLKLVREAASKNR